MATFLLTWNPKRWPWPTFRDDVAGCALGARAVRTWSTGNTRRVMAGDRLFLMKQGDRPRGLVASGRAIGDVVDVPHWDLERADRGESGPAVQVQFDAILDLGLQLPLALQEEPSPQLSSVNWSTPASGISIGNAAALEIERRWADHLSTVVPDPFVHGQQYSRDEVQRVLGLTPAMGGDWFTGYTQHNGEWYLFPNVGGPGRTGHDYGNRWEGSLLRWFGKPKTHVRQLAMRAILAPVATVRLFARESNRDRFTYHGRVRPMEILDRTPVEVLWEVLGSGSPEGLLPGEFQSGMPFIEGAVRQITVNAYERSAAARAACLGRWGTACTVCGLDMEARYGPIASGFIHVHHLRSLSDIGAAYEVDPVNDLRPVCPNCHAIIHLRKPALSIEEATALLSRT